MRSSRSIAVVTVLLLFLNTLVPVTSTPALGQKLDNFLNPNIPYMTLDYQCEVETTQETSIYSAEWLSTQENCQGFLEFEYYDELEAEEKIKVGSQNFFQSSLSNAGSWVTSAIIGVAAAKLGAKVAPQVAASTTGQVSAGVFGGAVDTFTGWGRAAGSY